MTKDELLYLYDNCTIEELSVKANEICLKNYGNKVFLRGLIEFSNYCDKDCLYCGIRNSNGNVKRYRLTEDEIINAVTEGFKSGLKTFVLQSGEDEYFTIDKLAKIIEQIKTNTDGQAALTLSVGIKTKKEFNELKKAGADRYLLRFETSDEKLHSYLRNGISLKRRLQALTDLKDLDFEVGSGFMVGLPDETDNIRLNNLMLSQEFGFDMVGIGPFIPHQETPLKDAKQEPLELTIKMVSLLRMVLPFSNIPATTAAGSLSPEGREKMLSAGANVLMPNITPVGYKKDYLLYPGKICLDEDGFQCISCLDKRIKIVNKEISFGRGDSISYAKRNV